jgi:hypothetical protein
MIDNIKSISLNSIYRFSGRQHKPGMDISLTPSDANGNEQLALVFPITYVVCIAFLVVAFVTVYMEKKGKDCRRPSF